jgi:hypothetical protein
MLKIMKKEAIARVSAIRVEHAKREIAALREVVDLPLRAIWDNPEAATLFGKLLKVQSPRWVMGTLLSAAEDLLSPQEYKQLEDAMHNRGATVTDFARALFSEAQDADVLENRFSEERGDGESKASENQVKEMAEAIKRLYFACDLIPPEAQEADYTLEEWRLRNRNIARTKN